MKGRTMILICVTVLDLAAVAYGAASRYIVHVSRIGNAAVAVSCMNGADPTGTKVGEAVIMTCDEVKELK